MLTAAAIGIFSSFHCIAMCGAIIGALSLGFARESNNSPFRFFSYLLSLNFGRICVYTLAGAVAGAFGGVVSESEGEGYGRLIMKMTAVVFMAGFGLNMAGWFPGYARLEKMGAPLWNRISPLMNGISPSKSIFHAMLFGGLWGLLPCGFVYTALVWTASSGGAADGALYMASFGLGTLPSTIVLGSVTRWAEWFGRAKGARRAAALVIIALAIWSAFSNEIVTHHHH